MNSLLMPVARAVRLLCATAQATSNSQATVVTLVTLAAGTVVVVAVKFVRHFSTTWRRISHNKSIVRHKNNLSVYDSIDTVIAVHDDIEVFPVFDYCNRDSNSRFHWRWWGSMTSLGPNKSSLVPPAFPDAQFYFYTNHVNEEHTIRNIIRITRMSAEIYFKDIIPSYLATAAGKTEECRYTFGRINARVNDLVMWEGTQRSVFSLMHPNREIMSAMFLSHKDVVSEQWIVLSYAGSDDQIAKTALVKYKLHSRGASVALIMSGFDANVHVRPESPFRLLVLDCDNDENHVNVFEDCLNNMNSDGGRRGYSNNDNDDAILEEAFGRISLKEIDRICMEDITLDIKDINEEYFSEFRAVCREASYWQDCLRERKFLKRQDINDDIAFVFK
jgi:hypothetical protein